jgi:pyruvate, water dikinase
VIERRRQMVNALETKAPPPAMNEPPAVITEPFTIMLFGITTERVNAWLSGAEAGDALSGMAASPGRVEGVARVVLDAADLADVQPGDVLVTRVTAPSWGPVFDRAAAVVTDIGGMMSHAAIICREYGLPAVTGTGGATAAIATGDRVIVDGDAGTVTIDR